MFKITEAKRTWFPMATQLEGDVWKFSLRGPLPEQADFAWYVYAKERNEPIFKGDYSTVSEYLYTFTSSGLYKIKCFCRSRIEKTSATTDWFNVNID